MAFAPQLASLPTLARRLDLPAAWLKTEADAGRLPHLRIGRRLLFDVAAVERELLRRAATPGEGDQEGRK
jgi:hypothetical protein